MTRIGNRVASFFYRINDQSDFVIFDHVHHMRPAFSDLVNHAANNARCGNRCSSTFGGHNVKLHAGEVPGIFNCTQFVVIFNG